jgi:hypothetical protein
MEYCPVVAFQIPAKRKPKFSDRDVRNGTVGNEINDS